MILQVLFVLWLFSLFGMIPGIALCMIFWVDLMRNNSTVDLLGFNIEKLFYTSWTKPLRNTNLPKSILVLLGMILLSLNVLMWIFLSFCGTLFSIYMIGRLFLLYIMNSVGMPIKITEDC